MDSSKLLTIEQARALLGRVGVDVPANVPPQTVFSTLNGVLNGVPDRLVAAAAIPGAEVRVSTQPGLTLPPFSPLNYQFNIGIEGKVKLSDAEMGPGFQQTQTFKASVQLQQEDRIALEKTLINRLYGWSKYADHLPADARKLLDSTPFQQWKDKIDRNPVASAIAKGPPISIAHTEFQGSRLTYEAVVPLELGKKIAAGDKNGFPNPLDPVNMPVGSSVLIRGQDLKGAKTEIGYKFGIAGQEVTRLDGHGFGVRRLEGSMVEVYSGPISTIENSAYLGLGRRNGASVRFEFENSLEDRRLSVARIDLNTPQGQAAYKQFLEAGKVPDKLAPGVTQVGNAQEISVEQARKLGITLGSAGISFDNSTTNLITTSNLGGKHEIKFNYSRAGQVASEAVFPLSPDGKRIDVDNGQYKLLLPKVETNMAGTMREAYGGHPGKRALGDSPAVELSFDSRQLMELRERSRAAIAARQPDGARQLAALDAGNGDHSDPIARIAGAKTPVDVFRVMQIRPDQVPEMVARLYVGSPSSQRQPLPGSLAIQPPAEMRATLENASETDRAKLIDQYYRAPSIAAPPVRRADAAEPQSPSLASRDHPDHALFAAVKDKAPPTLSDDQIAVLTANAKQAGITANRLEQVAADPARPDQVWVIGSVPGFRAKVDLSQAAQPFEQTSSELLAQTPTRTPISPEPQPRAAVQL